MLQVQCVPSSVCCRFCVLQFQFVTGPLSFWFSVLQVQWVAGSKCCRFSVVQLQYLLFRCKEGLMVTSTAFGAMGRSSPGPVEQPGPILGRSWLGMDRDALGIVF